jgi:hypothetical protein
MRLDDAWVLLIIDRSSAISIVSCFSEEVDQVILAGFSLVGFIQSLFIRTRCASNFDNANVLLSITKEASQRLGVIAQLFRATRSDYQQREPLPRRGGTAFFTGERECVKALSFCVTLHEVLADSLKNEHRKAFHIHRKTRLMAANRVRKIGLTAYDESMLLRARVFTKTT